MKIFIAFCVSAILGAFISVYPYWILMLHTLVIAMLGMAIGYLGYELKEYGILNSDDWKIGLWCLGVSLFIGILIVKFVGTPILYTALYCIAIPVIITTFKVLNVNNEIVDPEYLRVALVSSFFTTLLFTFIPNGWMSLISGGIVGVTGMLGTIFFITPFFRWTIAVLGWLVGGIVIFSVYYVFFQHWKEGLDAKDWTGGAIILIILITGSYYWYYRLGKFFFIKWWAFLPRRQRIRSRATIVPKRQPTTSPQTPERDVDIKFIEPTTETTSNSTQSGGLSFEARLITNDRIGCKCPVCGEVFNSGDRVIHCPVCDAIYHDRGGNDNCWKFNGGCAVYGCKGKDSSG